MFWKIETEIFGSVPRIRVLIITMGNPFSILQQRMGLAVIQCFIFMKTWPEIFGSAPGVEQAVTMGNIFEILQRKTGCPIMILILLWKTKPGKSGLAQGAMPVFMMEKHLRFSETKMVKP